MLKDPIKQAKELVLIKSNEKLELFQTYLILKPKILVKSKVRKESRAKEILAHRIFSFE